MLHKIVESWVLIVPYVSVIWARSVQLNNYFPIWSTSRIFLKFSYYLFFTNSPNLKILRTRKYTLTSNKQLTSYELLYVV